MESGGIHACFPDSSWGPWLLLAQPHPEHVHTRCEQLHAAFHIVCEIRFPGEAGDVALPTMTLLGEFGGVFSEVRSCSRHPFPALRDIPSSRGLSPRGMLQGLTRVYVFPFSHCAKMKASV